MADQAKTCTEKECCKSGGSALKYLLGIVFLIAGGMLIYTWRHELAVILKGCAGIFLVLVGLVTLAIAKE